ncbi:hypothetical protein E2562_018731 [Oryza meyeriana var. granulata]|uniref:Uncharacterized protein n=1 Tax=Oryza meyeriana var. granulata TaxID=110450 RepID=A0A6G1EMS6_9ORYZ|nr:hypothetical protein E2562_018731 [Oryza meyeriana var. granulata]
MMQRQARPQLPTAAMVLRRCRRLAEARSCAAARRVRDRCDWRARGGVWGGGVAESLKGRGWGGCAGGGQRGGRPVLEEEGGRRLAQERRRGSSRLGNRRV